MWDPDKTGSRDLDRLYDELDDALILGQYEVFRDYIMFPEDWQWLTVLTFIRQVYCNGEQDKVRDIAKIRARIIKEVEDEGFGEILKGLRPEDDSIFSWGQPDA